MLFDRYFTQTLNKISMTEGFFRNNKPTPVVNSGDNTYPCSDCHKDASEYRMYMVNDDIWKKYGNATNRLCPECLEKRMGRPLVFSDFSQYMKYPVNYSNPDILKLKST